MGFLHDYIDFVENKSFEEIPFNEIDGVIFSMLPFVDGNIAFPKRGKRSFFHCLDRHVKVHQLNAYGLIISSDIAKMVYRASKTKRFKNCLIHNYCSLIDLREETQSTSLVVDITEDISVIVYSGTDDTLVGWKEDFNMIYNSDVPCLRHSLEYLNNVGKQLNKFYIVGHSKGGMEAFYSYAFAEKEIKEKTIRAYSYDGPGLSKELCEQISESTKKKMTLIVPQGGIVGRLFNSPIEPNIIYSSYRGLQQHDPMSWEINRGRLHFHRVDSFNVQSNTLMKKIESILDSLDAKQRKEFVKYLFDVLSAGKSLTLTQMGKQPHEALKKFLKLPPNIKKLISSLLIYLSKDKIIAQDLLLGIIGMTQKSLNERF